MTLSAYLIKRKNDHTAQIVKECLDNNVITIGYPLHESNLDTIMANPAEARGVIMSLVSEKYGPRSPGRITGMIYKFLFEVVNGTYIVLPNQKGAFHIGRVTSLPMPVQNSQFTDASFYRDVEWSPNLFSANATDSALRGKLNIRGSSCNISDCKPEIERLLQADEATLKNGQWALANMPIQEAIESKLLMVLGAHGKSGAITPASLEKFVAALFEASGATVKLTAGSNEKGCDVIASFPIGLPSVLGATKDSHVVGIQVKQHQHETGEGALTQLLEGVKQRRENSEQIDHAVLITTAETVANEGEYEDDDRVTIITRDGLIDLIIEAGLDKVLDAYQRRVQKPA
ncbi:MAG: restriction endonuclease [Alphaproteobacteria bacterium]|nr:restriction endonuclease [Alphaproteobacteria bacterium]